MKKLFFLLGIIILFSGCSLDSPPVVTQQKSSYDPQTGWYVNQTEQVRFQVPKGWLEKNDSEKLLNKENEKLLVLFFPKKSIDVDIPAENFSLALETGLPPSFTLEDYTKAVDKQFSELDPNHLFKAEESKIISVNGEPAGVKIFSFKKPDGTVRFTQEVYIIKNQQAYLFSFAAPEKEFHRDSTLIQKTIDSITFESQ